MTKYGKIFTYANKDKAKIGKKYVFSDFLEPLVNRPEKYTTGSLLKIVDKEACFTLDDGTVCPLNYPFICEIIEEPELMTRRQLSEWCAKGHGEWAYINGKETAVYGNAFHYAGNLENEPVTETDFIRPWGSNEWIKPTVDIYNRDCRK